MNLRSRKRAFGFTIVELLIVIVVIGILAAITLVVFSGIDERARAAKIKSDIKTLDSAISAARVNSSKTLWGLTGGRTGGDGIITADECNRLADGTDFSTLPQTHACWVKYNDTLNAISQAGEVNVRGLKDPDGRPYFIYEYEERATNPCDRDRLSAFAKPHVMWGADWDYMHFVSNSLPQC